ncbi:hypothetical protein M758_UG311100 [Ceratodon purpureus]|nr:hypothetical protein M758_UG311100 [Ceratodon purpureus]
MLMFLGFQVLPVRTIKAGEVAEASSNPPIQVSGSVKCVALSSCEPYFCIAKSLIRATPRSSKPFSWNSSTNC